MSDTDPNAALTTAVDYIQHTIRLTGSECQIIRDAISVHFSPLVREWSELKAENARLLADAKVAQMQLVACMAATVQNTATTIKDRIARGHPYWSQAYADVCTAIDREMRLLADKARLDWLIAHGYCPAHWRAATSEELRSGRGMKNGMILNAIGDRAAIDAAMQSTQQPAG